MRTRIHSVIFIVFLSILLMTISVFASGQIEIFEPAEQEKEETIAESAEAFINSDEAEVFVFCRCLVCRSCTCQICAPFKFNSLF